MHLGREVRHLYLVTTYSVRLKVSDWGIGQSRVNIPNYCNRRLDLGKGYYAS